MMIIKILRMVPIKVKRTRTIPLEESPSFLFFVIGSMACSCRQFLAIVVQFGKKQCGDVLNPDSYDLWHNKTCETIIEKFSPCAQLKYGQSQKWLNMICKYLCVFEEPHVRDLFRWLHAPIDTIVFERALKVRNISNKAWSN